VVEKLLINKIIKYYFKFLRWGSEKMLDKVFVFKYFQMFYVTRLKSYSFLEWTKQGA